MKIMSYIQKTIYALFLLALFSGCTDEVLDGGGNGSTPIEEGKLVDVKFVLDQAGAKTVMTRSDDDPDVDDGLLFLQYKNGDLVHAWYTGEDNITNITNPSDDDFEGEGVQGTVTVKLLSGDDYHVYVVANLELGGVVFGDGDDEEKISIDVTDNHLITGEFGRENNLLSWRKSSSHFVDDDEEEDDDDDDPVMFAVASGSDDEQMKGPNYGNVYQYTQMATSLSTDGGPVNDMINFANNIPSVAINESASIRATLYPPYAKVALKIEAKGLKKTVKITSVKVINCPLDYSLVNGFNLKSNPGCSTGEYTFDFDDFDDDDEYIELQGDRKLNSNFKNPVYIFENMAGVLNSDSQQGKVPADFDPGASNESEAYDDAAKGYTYIKVTGECEGKLITYRFILGSDEYANCNVERNVFYKVTMTLTGDAGVNEPTWRVEYDGASETPEVEDHDVLSRLDAHASVKEFTIKNMKKETYYYIGVNNNYETCTIDVDANDYTYPSYSEIDTYYTYNDFAGGFKYALDQGPLVNMHKGNGDQFYKVVISEDGDYTFKYRQLSWFDYGMVISLPTDNPYNIKNPITVASANPNTYYLHIYEGNEKGIGTKVATLKVTQYPPVVVTQRTGAGELYSNYTISFSDTYAYMERFNTDHNIAYNLSEQSWNSDTSLGTGWSSTTSEDIYKDFMFNYEDQNGHWISEYCYWANLNGVLNGNTTRTNNGANSWPYDLQLEGESERYIIPWMKN